MKYCVNDMGIVDRLSVTRRRFLALAGVSTTGIAGSGISQAEDTNVTQRSARNPRSRWKQAKVPTSNTLTGVTQTVAGPYAVGGSGDMITRSRKRKWELVLDAGPTGEGNKLTAVDVTSDGKRIWFVGGSGVIGEYDTVRNRLTDHSAPLGKTSTWSGVAVEGNSGENEHVYFVNSSGEELSGVRQPDGSIAYEPVTKPGGGSTIPGIDFHGLTTGRCCDTSGGVYETDGGNTYKRIGIDGAESTFYDIASVDTDTANVVGAGGLIYRYDGIRWTPIITGEKAIRAIDRDGRAGLAAGSGGYIYNREIFGQWTQVSTPTSNTLKGVALDPTGVYPDVAVGNSGTVIERTL
jgi:hypothetical protein